MHYYVLNQQKQYFEFNEWTDLICWIRRNITTYPENIKFYIGHNLNDSYTQPKIFGSSVREKFFVQFVVFDQDWRVLRLEQLEEGLIDIRCPIRKRKFPKRNYQYRYDPVPGIRNSKNSYSFWKSGAKLQERRAYERDKDIIPHLKIPSYTDPWDDVLSSWTRNCNKTWKRLKIKKQWMKHI